METQDEQALGLVKQAGNVEILAAAYNVLTMDLFKTESHAEDVGVLGIRIASIYRVMDRLLGTSEDPPGTRLNNRIAFRKLVVDFIDLMFEEVSEPENVGSEIKTERTSRRRFARVKPRPV